MSAPGGAPSPGPRSGSMGPGVNGNGMAMPSQQPLPGTPVHSAPTPGPSAPPSGAMSQQNLNQIVGAIVIHLCVVREVFVVPLCCPFAMIVPCTLCPSYVFQNQPSLRSLIYGDVSNGFPQNVMLGIQDRGLLSHFASTPTTLKMPRALEHPVHHLLQLLDDD